MRVLIGCEYSGVVRDEFRKRGHDAWSVDLLPTEADPRWHIVGDVFDALENRGPWDFFGFHWPCTRLCNSGVRWLDERDLWDEMRESARGFRRCLDADVPLVYGENPIPHKYAREIMGDYSQVIQPWQFGHGETTATCLWLKGLPPLRPTKVVAGRTPRVHHASPWAGSLEGTESDACGHRGGDGRAVGRVVANDQF